MREMRAASRPGFTGQAFGVRVQKGRLTGPQVMAACQRRVV
jgi:hypothetical protein